MNDWDTLVAEAEGLGYTVELVEYCECADSPGILGSRAGVCIPSVKRILVREMLDHEDRVTVLAHELEHARGAGHEIDAPGVRPLLRYEVAVGEAFTREELAHELVGGAEIAEILGVTTGSANAYLAGNHPVSLGPPPAPVAALKMGRVWLRCDIEQWAMDRLS